MMMISLDSVSQIKMWTNDTTLKLIKDYYGASYLTILKIGIKINKNINTSEIYLFIYLFSVCSVKPVRLLVVHPG